jgi:hypothetical protein
MLDPKRYSRLPYRRYSSATGAPTSPDAIRATRPASSAATAAEPAVSVTDTASSPQQVYTRSVGRTVHAGLDFPNRNKPAQTTLRRITHKNARGPALLSAAASFVYDKQPRSCHRLTLGTRGHLRLFKNFLLSSEPLKLRPPYIRPQPRKGRHGSERRTTKSGTFKKVLTTGKAVNGSSNGNSGSGQIGEP